MSDDFIPFNQSTPIHRKEKGRNHNQRVNQDFIPFNQSTPIHGRWQGRNHNQRGYQNYWSPSSGRRGGNGRNIKSGNRMQQDSNYMNESNSSYGQQQDRSSIDSYIHPSMLQDPWAHLREKMNDISK